MRAIVPLFVLMLIDYTSSFLSTTAGQKASLHLQAKGFGSSPSPAPKKAKSRASSKASQAKVLKSYGGDIQKGTAQRIAKSMAEILENEPKLHEAMTLTRQTARWEAVSARMSVIELSRLPESDVMGYRKVKSRLEELEGEGVTPAMVQGAFQRITWDASAEAKGSRSALDIPDAMIRKLKRGFEPLVEACKNNGALLDVGCGTGLLLPHLKRSGISPDQYTGIDLSTEMIRVASDSHLVSHPGASFIAGDFFAHSGGYNGVLFCMSLHDLPDIPEALKKAAGMIPEGGIIVAMDPKGTSHVMGQVSRSPELVLRGLPDASECEDILRGQCELVQAPADFGSSREEELGYLAVWRRL